MTPLLQKLNFKQQAEVVVLHAPESFKEELESMRPFARVLEDHTAVDEVVFALVFVLNKAQIDAAIEVLFPKLKGDDVLWFCYPKGSSKKYKSEINRDQGWQQLGSLGFEPVRQVAIDADWSALRFRKVSYIKTLNRRTTFALSEEGKAKTKRKE